MQMVSEVRLILKKIVENILVLMKNIYINSKSGRVKQINENKCWFWVKESLNVNCCKKGAQI